MAKKQENLVEDDIDTFVPDSRVREEFDVSAMCLHRWDKDEALGFPPAIYIRGRKYRSRRMLNEFKARFLKTAIASRGQVGKPANRGPKAFTKRAAA